jgi:hypothetical protein
MYIATLSTARIYHPAPSCPSLCDLNKTSLSFQTLCIHPLQLLLVLLNLLCTTMAVSVEGGRHKQRCFHVNYHSSIPELSLNELYDLNSLDVLAFLPYEQDLINP